jgi:hypothetical protein
MKTFAYAALILGLIFGAKKLYFDIHSCENFEVKSNLAYHTIVFKKGKADFAVTSNHKDDFDFYVNSNFFTESARAIGGVVVQGHRVSAQIPGGGSFVVKNGRPQIAFGQVNGCEYLSQSIIWAIKNGKINERVICRAHAKELTMRLLIGKTENGEIVIIHSNPLVLVTLSNALEFAKAAGLKNAIVLDSGSSIDLKVSTDSYSHTVKSIPSIVKRIVNINEPVTYIAGNFN